MSESSGVRRFTGANLLALALPAVMAIGAIAVEHSHRVAVQAELQATADIAASAGAYRLDGTSAGVEEAVAAAYRAAARNTAGGESVHLDDADISTGYWDEAAGGFVESASAAEINALRVRASRGDYAANFASVAIGSADISTSLR